MAHIHLDPLYQTISNNGTKEYIEKFGPIYSREHTWLGNGYYFWEGAIELAQWWGRVHYLNDYIVCEATADFEKEDMFDLFGSTSDLKVFRDIANELKDKFRFQELTVSAVLTEMRKLPSFNFSVIRATSNHIIDSNVIKFVEDDRHVLYMLPAVQICFSNRKYINNYHVIYFPQDEQGPYV